MVIFRSFFSKTAIAARVLRNLTCNSKELSNPKFLFCSRTASSSASISKPRKMSRFDVRGLYVATFTPMHENGDVNPDAIPDYLNYLAKHQIPGIFVHGTAGEGLSMTVAERKSMTEVWVREGKARNMKVMVHCGAVSLHDAMDLASHAEGLGVDAISAVPSFYFTPKNPAALVDQLVPVAKAAPNTPFLYYHIPRMTNVEVDMSSFLTEAKHRIATLAGMKYSGFDLAGAVKCHSEHGNEFEIMWGRDDVLLGALSIGIKSFIGSTYNFTAPIANRIVKAFEAGDLETARKEQLNLKRVMDLAERHGEQVASFKACASLVGLPVGPARLPLKGFDVHRTTAMQTALVDLGYFGWVGDQ